VSHTVEVRGLRVVATIGVPDDERARLQPLRIDLDIELEVPGASRSDDVADTVDYAGLCELASSTIAERRPRLLETACDAIGATILEADPRIVAVTVSIAKLRPPVGLDVDTVGVRRRCSR
jgi:dihydroneopterin aldolase